MRPTFEEQLTGASRLLRLAELEPDDAVSLVRDARRLIDHVVGGWLAMLPFLIDDNARTAALVGVDPGSAMDLDGAARRNEELRGVLAERIRGLPPGPDRTAIAAHLRARIDADPA